MVDDGKPQSPTAGRFEILQELRGKAEPRPRRWYDVPMWYRVLDRFGLPTLFLLITLGGVGWTGRFILTKWDEHERAVAAAMTQQANATVNLATKVEEMNDTTGKALTIVLVHLGYGRQDTIGPPADPSPRRQPPAPRPEGP